MGELTVCDKNERNFRCIGVKRVVRNGARRLVLPQGYSELSFAYIVARCLVMPPVHATRIATPQSTAISVTLS